MSQSVADRYDMLYPKSDATPRSAAVERERVQATVSNAGGTAALRWEKCHVKKNAAPRLSCLGDM